MALDPSLENVLPSSFDRQQASKGLVGSALSSGFHEMLGSLAGAGEAVGAATGWDRLAQGSRQRAVEQQAAAQAAANPEYEGKWTPGGIAYGVLKSLPSLGAMVAGSMLVPEAVVPAGLARLGMMAPEALGGGRALMAAGDMAAAQAAGTQLARTAVGGAAGAYPLMVGGNMNAAHEGGRTPGQAEGVKALAMGIPEAAIGSVAPTGIANRWGANLGEGFLKRFAGGTAAMAPAMGAQSAATTWMTQALGDPNKSTSDRFGEVIDSFLHGAVTGGIVGGALHSVAGPRTPKASPAPEVAPAPEAPAPAPAPAPLMLTHDPLRLTHSPEQMPAPGSTLDLARQAREQANSEVLADREAAQTQQQPVANPNQMLVDGYRQSVSDALGVSKPRDEFLAKSGATNEIEAYRAVGDAVESAYATDTAVPKHVAELADHLGYTRDGAPIDFAAETAAAQAKLDKAQTRYDKNSDIKSNQSALVKAQQAVDEAQARQQRHEQAYPEIAQEREAQAQQLREAADRQAQADAADRLANAKPADVDLVQRAEIETNAERAVGDAAMSEADRQNQQRTQAEIATKGFGEDLQRAKAQETEATFGETPLGDQRLREMGDAETKLREVLTNGDNKRIPVKLRKGANDALKALDEGNVDELGRLTADQESALRLAYKRLGFKATDADMTAPKPRDNALDQANAPLNETEAAARRAQVEQGLQRDPNAPAPEPKVTGDLADPAARPEIGTIARKMQQRMEAPRSPEEQVAEMAHEAATTSEEKANLALNDVPSPEAVQERAQARVDDATRSQAEIIRQKLADRAAVERTLTPLPEIGNPSLPPARRAAALKAADFFSKAGVNELSEPMQRAVGKALDAHASGRMTDTQGSILINAVKAARERRLADEAIAKASQSEQSAALDPTSRRQDEASRDAREREQMLRRADRSETRLTRDVAEGEQAQGSQADPVERSIRPMNSIEQTPKAKWVEQADVEGAYGARHIWSDDSVMLVRSIKAGQTVYRAMERRSRQAYELDSQRAATVFGDKIDALRAAADQAAARDAEMAQANPDGMFQEGARLVVGARVPGHINAFVKKLNDMTGFTGRIAVLTRDDIAAMPPLSGRFAAVDSALSTASVGLKIDLGGGDYAIVVPRGGGGKMRQMEVAAHEYGHAFEQQELGKLSPETQQAINTDFEARRQRAVAGTVSRMFGLMRPARDAKFDQAAVGERGMRPARDADPYWTSKNEYFADQFSRWAMTKEEAVSTVDKFFQGVGRKLREIYAAALGRKSLPDAAFKKMMDDRVEMQRRSEMEQRVADQSDGPVGAPRRLDEDMRSPADVNIQGEEAKDAGTFIRDAYKAAQDYAPKGLNVANFLRNKGGYDVMTMGRLTDLVKDTVPSIGRMYDLVRNRMAAQDFMAQTASGVVDRVNRTFSGPQKQSLNKVLGYVAMDLDPRIPLSNHQWLSPAERGGLAGMYADAQKAYQQYRQVTKGDAALDQIIDFGAATKNANAAVKLRDAARTIPNGIGRDLANPMDAYRTQDAIRGDAAKTRDFFKSQAEANLALVEGYVKGEMSDMAQKRSEGATEASLQTRRAALVPLEQVIADVKPALSSDRPYTHLGRSGDWGVRANLLRGADGVVSPKTLQGMRDLLNANGFDNVMIHDFGRQDRMFFRMEKPEQAKSLYDLLNTEGRKRGLIYDDGKNKTLSTSNVSALSNGVLPGYMLQGASQLIERATQRMHDAGVGGDEGAIRAQAQREVLGALMKDYLDAQPTSSVYRLNQHRRLVHGANDDMLQSYIWRTGKEMGFLARRAYATDYNSHVADAQKQIADYGRKGDVDSQSVGVNSLRSMMKREFDRPMTDYDSWVSWARQGTSSFAFAASVPFTIMQTTQPFITALPRLIMQHSSTSSMAALMKAAPKAMRVIREIARSDNPLATMDRAALKRAGLNADQANSIMGAVNDGIIGVGGFIHDVSQSGRGAANAKIDWAMRTANMMGTYGEVFSRVMTALAAHDLHTAKTGEVGRQDYVNKIVREGMGDMGAHAASRLETFNPIARIMLQFSRYPADVLGGLYDQVQRAVTKGASGKDREEALRYLGAHAAALTVLAGSTSLPGMQMFTGVGSNVMNRLTGRDDWDLEGSYRNFLRTQLGDTLGDVVAKGVPRALGVDLSRSLGEGNMLPFTQLLSDRRKMEETIQDWASNSMGAATSTGARLIEGARDTLDGNYMRAMQKMLPTALRGPMDAYLMANYGYETASGAPMPIGKPTGSEIALRAIGLTPTRKAQMSEQVEANQQLQGAYDYRSTVIRENLMRAWRHGDGEAAQHWAMKAQEMAMDHPDKPILAGIGQALAQRQFQAAQGQTLGMPLGVGMFDANRQRGLHGYSVIGN